jgi:hypothetical protein
MTYMECRHIKSNGCKCKSPALRGMPYCYFHMRLHRSAHAGESKSGAAIDVPAIEDRTDVQLALTRILQELGAKRLKPRDAGLFLYGLQIASQVVDRPHLIFSEEYVQTLTTDKDGDELAPDVYVCNDDDDCEKCPFVETCNKWVYLDNDEEKKDNKDNDRKDTDDDK